MDTTRDFNQTCISNALTTQWLGNVFFSPSPPEGEETHVVGGLQGSCWQKTKAGEQSMEGHG